MGRHRVPLGRLDMFQSAPTSGGSPRSGSCDCLSHATSQCPVPTGSEGGTGPPSGAAPYGLDRAMPWPCSNRMRGSTDVETPETEVELGANSTAKVGRACCDY